MTGFMFIAQKCPEKLKEDKIKHFIIMHKTYASFNSCSHKKYKLPHLSRYTESHAKGISGAETPTVHVDFGVTGLALGIT